MASTDTFDAALYTRAPILGIAAAITLGRALADGCPKSMPANCKKAAKQLGQTVDAAESAWAARKSELGAISDEDSRQLDQFTDNLFSALRARIQAYSVLPAADFPKAARAGAIGTMLFGAEGLSFLKDPYADQFAGMGALLKQINDEKLQKDIDDVAGPEFLHAIKAVMPRYKAMVQAMLHRDDASGQNLLEHVRAIQRAIVNYSTKICATVEDDDPKTADVARQVLLPILKVREQGAGRRDGGGEGAPEAAKAAGGEGAPT